MKENLFLKSIFLHEKPCEKAFFKAFVCFASFPISRLLADVDYVSFNDCLMHGAASDRSDQRVLLGEADHLY